MRWPYEYIEYTASVPASELAPPHPLSRKRVCLSPRNRGGRGGGHTRLRAREWGGRSQIQRLEEKLSTLSILCG